MFLLPGQSPVLQPVLHRSKEEWAVASHFRSENIGLKAVCDSGHRFPRVTLGGEAYKYRVLRFGLALIIILIALRSLIGSFHRLI